MRASITIDPLVTALLDRAGELAGREGSASIGLGHVLRAVFSRPITPALLHHLHRGSALADDAASSAVSDVHLLLAIVNDDSTIGFQSLARHADITALQQDLQLQVDSFDATEEP